MFKIFLFIQLVSTLLEMSNTEDMLVTTECRPGTVFSKDERLCVKCPIGTYNYDGSSSCDQCSYGYFSNKEGSTQCTKCGSGTKSNKNRDGCDYNGCTFTTEGGIKFDLSPLKRDGGAMYKVRTIKRKYQILPLFYYINICTLNHDNSSCTTPTNNGRPSIGSVNSTTKVEIIRTMACKRWSFDRLHSYSIGEVLSFEPWKENITKGLYLKLDGGHKCWNKGSRQYEIPQTTILMECDMNAGVGYPETYSNTSAIDAKQCKFELRWKTLYACPVCHEKDYEEIAGPCKNGKQTITMMRRGDCRSEHDIDDVRVFTIGCKEYSISFLKVKIESSGNKNASSNNENIINGTDGNQNGTDGNQNGTDGNQNGTDGNKNGTDGNQNGPVTTTKLNIKLILVTVFVVTFVVVLIACVIFIGKGKGGRQVLIFSPSRRATDFHEGEGDEMM